MKNDIWQSLCLTHVNSNVYANVYQSIPLSSSDRTIFTFFRIWRSAKPLPMINAILHFFRIFWIWTSAKTQPISNVIWQSHGVYLININVYAKFHHNIPLSSRDSAIITFSEFGARQSLDRWTISFRLDLVNINVYAKVYQNIPLSSRDMAIFTFSEFGARQSLDRW